MTSNHIDLGTVLRQTLSANLYSNLGTRPTGRAVRTQIELMLSATTARDRVLTVIDFSHVSMIDFSCADEVIAKLLLAQAGGEERETYLVFRGMTDHHWPSIEQVLGGHALALVVESGSGVELMGVLDERERRAWNAIKRRGSVTAAQLAGELGEPEAAMRGALDGLWRRRLIMRHHHTYRPVGTVS